MFLTDIQFRTLSQLLDTVRNMPIDHLEERFVALEAAMRTLTRKMDQFESASSHAIETFGQSRAVVSGKWICCCSWGVRALLPFTTAARASNSLTVILDTNGNIFGGFDPIAWTSRDSIGESDENCYKADLSLQSIIFTPRNEPNFPAWRFGL
jgi:hypothetical protein